MIRDFICQAQDRAATRSPLRRKGSVLIGSVGARLDDALAAIETIRRDAVTQVRFAGLGIDRQRRPGNRIV
jgi:hypothetical protein